MNWSMSGHDRRHWQAPSSTDHCIRAISRVYTGRFAHSIFPDVTLRPWFEGHKEERRFVCTLSMVLSGHCSVRSHIGRFQIVGDLICVCAGDYETMNHLILHCKRFRLERHCLIDALAALKVSIGIPICDLCALKKWCTVKCCWRVSDKTLIIRPFFCI
jgi:hypothetical protein